MLGGVKTLRASVYKTDETPYALRKAQKQKIHPGKQKTITPEASRIMDRQILKIKQSKTKSHTLYPVRNLDST